MMNARVPDQNVSVHVAPDSTSAIVGELQPSTPSRDVTESYKIRTL